MHTIQPRPQIGAWMVEYDMGRQLPSFHRSPELAAEFGQAMDRLYVQLELDTACRTLAEELTR